VEKCNGKLVIENKKKVALIQELVDKKYDSDPVKKWKNDQKSLEDEVLLLF
jgi:DNA topoisomerase-2